MNFPHLPGAACLCIFLAFPPQAQVPSELPENKGSISGGNTYHNPVLSMTIILPGEWHFFDRTMDSSTESKQKEMEMLERARATCLGALSGPTEIDVALQSPSAPAPCYAIFLTALKLSAEYQNRERHPLKGFAETMTLGSLGDTWVPEGNLTPIQLSGRPAYRLIVHNKNTTTAKGLLYVADANGQVFMLLGTAMSEPEKLQSALEQMSLGKPETPTAKTGLVAIPLPGTSLASHKSAREPNTLPDLPALATEIAKYAAVKSCVTKKCSILVTNFLLPDGDTSRYGIQVADELSKDLASQGNNIQVTDRGLLQELLIKDRVPGKSIDGTVARSIALELESTFVVIGATQIKNDGTVQLSARLLGTVDKEWSGYRALVNLPAPRTSVELVPSEPFADLPSITTTASGETVVLHGATSPNCMYMPNPPYSEEARKFKVSGFIITEAVLNMQGGLENLRIIRGLPGGLNETTLATLRTWRCNPAQKDGKNVPILIQFEVDFRLY